VKTYNQNMKSNTGFKLATLATALALGLIGKPCLAQAEINAVIVAYILG